MKRKRENTSPRQTNRHRTEMRSSDEKEMRKEDGEERRRSAAVKRDQEVSVSHKRVAHPIATPALSL